MKTLIFLVFSLGSIGFAQADVDFFVQGGTQGPLYIEIGGGLLIEEQISFNLGFINNPTPYANLLGEVTSQYTGEPADAELVSDALQKNGGARLSTNIYFSPYQEWFVQLGGAYMRTEGRSGIGTVLTSATGRDFSNLISLLQAAGRGTDAFLESELIILDLSLGRSISLSESTFLHLSLGAAKIVAADLTMSTELTNFDNSQAGNSLLRSTEEDLESILLNDVWSPILGVNFSYQF